MVDAPANWEIISYRDSALVMELISQICEIQSKCKMFLSISEIRGLRFFRIF